MNRLNTQRFISFEGIDFSGKSTQIRLLKEYLEKRGFRVYVLREPGGTEISERIRQILLDKNHSEMSRWTEIFLYSAARAQLVQQKIIPLLGEGYFVIADRYVDSTTAYQGYGRGIDLEIVTTINRAATSGVMPHLTFFMDLNPQEAYRRRRSDSRSTDRLEEAGREFFERIYNGYLQMAKQDTQRFVILDAMQPIQQIQQKIITVLNSKINL